MKEPFDKYYNEYDLWFEENNDIYTEELNFIKKHINTHKKGIEIGVGTGRFAIPLNIKYGIEPSLNMAKIAFQRGIKVIIGKAEQIPIKDNSFDFVLLNTVICFFDDLKESFKEIGRILRKNGYLYIFFIDKDTTLGKVYEEKKSKNKFYKYAHFFSKEEVEDISKDYFFIISIKTLLINNIEGMRLLTLKKIKE